MKRFDFSQTPFPTKTPTAATNQASNIRLLGKDDEDELCRIFLTLEPSARYCRFGRIASDASLVDHAKRSLANADWIVGAFVGERIRGSVEVYRGRPSSYVEAARVVVEMAHRALGGEISSGAVGTAACGSARRLSACLTVFQPDCCFGPAAIG
jgi:hypothetical protein